MPPLDRELQIRNRFAEVRDALDQLEAHAIKLQAEVDVEAEYTVYAPDTSWVSGSVFRYFEQAGGFRVVVTVKAKPEPV